MLTVQRQGHGEVAFLGQHRIQHHQSAGAPADAAFFTTAKRIAGREKMVVQWFFDTGFHIENYPAKAGKASFRKFVPERGFFFSAAFLFPRFGKTRCRAFQALENGRREHENWKRCGTFFQGVRAQPTGFLTPTSLACGRSICFLQGAGGAGATAVAMTAMGKDVNAQQRGKRAWGCPLQ